MSITYCRCGHIDDNDQHACHVTNEKLRKALSQRLQESHDYREIAERLEQGVLAIAATCPMSAMTRHRLTNLVRADQAPQEAVPGDLGLTEHPKTD